MNDEDLRILFSSWHVLPEAESMVKELVNLYGERIVEEYLPDCISIEYPHLGTEQIALLNKKICDNLLFYAKNEREAAVFFDVVFNSGTLEEIGLFYQEEIIEKAIDRELIKVFCKDSIFDCSLTENKEHIFIMKGECRLFWSKNSSYNRRNKKLIYLIEKAKIILNHFSDNPSDDDKLYLSSFQLNNYI